MEKDQKEKATIFTENEKEMMNEIEEAIKKVCDVVVENRRMIEKNKEAMGKFAVTNQLQTTAISVLQKECEINYKITSIIQKECRNNYEIICGIEKQMKLSKFKLKRMLVLSFVLYLLIIGMLWIEIL